MLLFLCISNGTAVLYRISVFLGIICLSILRSMSEYLKLSKKRLMGGWVKKVKGFKNNSFLPAGVAQLVGHHPQSERSLVWSLARTHAWIAGQIPSWGRARGNQSAFLPHIDVSPPCFLPPFPSL